MSTEYPVAASEDDWIVSFDTGVPGHTIVDDEDELNIHIRIFVVPPNDYEYTIGYAGMDTSGIVGTITKAEFHWLDLAQTTSPRTLPNSNIAISDQMYTGYVGIFSSALSVSGWRSVELAPAAIAKINRAGYTYFRFSVDDPGPGKWRHWQVATWDGGAPCYLEVWTAAGRRYRINVR